MSEPAAANPGMAHHEHLLDALRKDPAHAPDLIHAAALNGEIAAQFLLGQMCCEGRGRARDAAEGVHWFRLAANSGLPAAMNMLGRCHELGTGTACDFALAAVWYRKAALAGFDWGMYNLANLLATGRGLEPSRREAWAWYRKAAGLGHAKSMNLVGRYLEEGWEVEADALAAREWYRRSAEAGDFRGQASHAQILIGEGRIAEAVGWLRQAVLAGSPSFLAHVANDLAASAHAEIREIAQLARERGALAHAGAGQECA